MTSLDMRRCWATSRTLLRPDAAARHVALHLDVPADLPPVRGDRVQIQQVLLNLILNGMDSLEGVANRPRSVTVTARRDGPASVEISVADSGRGIAADQLGAHLRAVLHDQVQGHRHGAVDLAQHRRDPWRTPLGREQRRPRRDVPLHVADRRPSDGDAPRKLS